MNNGFLGLGSTLTIGVALISPSLFLMIAVYTPASSGLAASIL
jgi:hypothetical protein